MKSFVSMLRTTLVLLLICGISGGLVAGINLITRDAIAANEARELQEAMEALVPEIGSLTVTERPVDSSSVENLFALTDAEGAAKGYIAIASPQGYKDTIRMCVLINEECRVAGIRVLSSSETPGLGSRAVEDEYLDQFLGKSAELRFGAGIDAVSGATISSRAILNGLNEVLALCGADAEGGSK